MLTTCSICGIVEEGHVCPYKKHYQRRQKDSVADKFRSSKAWTRKSLEVRRRDRNLCLVCLANRYNTVNQLTFKDIGVHHIVPLKEDFDKRLENDNLITLCSFHHHLAEIGKIPRQELLELVQESIERDKQQYMNKE